MTSSPAAPPPAPAWLATAAAWSFLLWMVALHTAIAPMGIVLALCGTLTVVLMANRGGGWVRSPVDFAALGWLLALAIVAWCALDRAESLPSLKKGLLPAIVGLSAFHAASPRRGGRAVAVLLGAGAAVAAYATIMFVLHGATLPARARGIVGHYMTYGGQLLLLLSLAWGIALATRDRRWRLAALATLALGLPALAVTFTRSAWIGLVVALGIMLGLKRARWLLALGAVVVLAVVFAPGAWHARIVSIAEPANMWNQQRVFMWQAGWRMFLDHPLTGVGLQDLHALYERYRSPLATEAAGHLHSLYVMLAATTGVIGMAAFAWLYASLVRASASGLRAQVRRGSLAAGVRLGVTGALVGFLAAGLFEWNWGDEELLYLLFTLVGTAWAARDWDAP